MKIIMVNGSSKKGGNTHRALQEIDRVLGDEGIDTEEFHIGTKAISGCIDCRGCTSTGRCVISDVVNDFHNIASSADGFIFGTPVYFAGPTGGLVSFLDRLFFSSRFVPISPFYLKPAASVIVARRAGTSATFDQMNKYFALLEMPIIPSGYWNMAFGMDPGEVEKDAEGMKIMRTIARNMSWFLKCKVAGQNANVDIPKKEEPVFTHFISWRWRLKSATVGGRKSLHPSPLSPTLCG